jgi:hypothetical protein
MARYGITVPFAGIDLHSQAGMYRTLVDLGYTDVWSVEVDGSDAFTPLALAAVWAPSLRLGTAIVPVYTRGPGTLVQSAAAMASAAPGRFVLGIGASSRQIVERWNGIPFEAPYQRVRDVARFFQAAITGEKVTERYKTFAIDGFRLSTPPSVRPRLLIAALREGMLRLAGREADGAILNWLSADDVARVAPIVQQAGGVSRRRSSPESSFARRPTARPFAPSAGVWSPPISMCRSTPSITIGSAAPTVLVKCGRRGERGTGQKRSHPSPTRLSTNCWCMARRARAVITSRSMSPMASRRPCWQ